MGIIGLVLAVTEKAAQCSGSSSSLTSDDSPWSPRVCWGEFDPECVIYSYDALGRRIAKRSANTLFGTVLYWWDGWRCVEETNDTSPTPTVVKKYVFGNGIDEVLRVTLPDYADVDNDANTTELVDLYYHENSIGSIAALTRSDGIMVEAYRYDAYGALDEIQFRTPSTGILVTVTSSSVKNTILWQGRQLDAEEGSGLYYYRNRFYSPTLGRFLSRDPKGIWGDPSQLGNGQGAFSNNPLNRRDPFGLDDKVDADTQKWFDKLIDGAKGSDLWKKLEKDKDLLAGQKLTVTPKIDKSEGAEFGKTTPTAADDCSDVNIVFNLAFWDIAKALATVKKAGAAKADVAAAQAVLDQAALAILAALLHEASHAKHRQTADERKQARAGDATCRAYEKKMSAGEKPGRDLAKSFADAFGRDKNEHEEVAKLYERLGGDPAYKDLLDKYFGVEKGAGQKITNDAKAQMDATVKGQADVIKEAQGFAK